MADNKVEAASGGGDGSQSTCSWARARAVKDTAVHYLKRVPLLNFFVFLLVCPADAVRKSQCSRRLPRVGIMAVHAADQVMCAQRAVICRCCMQLMIPPGCLAFFMPLSSCDSCHLDIVCPCLGQDNMMEQANMIALVAALLITIALAAPLALTLDDFDQLTAKYEGPSCAQLAQFGVGTKTAGVFIGQCKIQQQHARARRAYACSPVPVMAVGPRVTPAHCVRAPCAMRHAHVQTAVSSSTPGSTTRRGRTTATPPAAISPAGS